MSESKPKRKGILAVALLILAGVEGVAIWTTTVGDALPRWLSWLPVLGDALRSSLPSWVYQGVLAYCATALLVIAYREWRQAKGTLARKRRNEIENLMNRVKGVLLETEPNRPEDRDSLGYTALDRAFEKLNEALVESSVYEYRKHLHEETSAMELRCFKNARRAFQRDEAEKFLAFLRRWVEFAAAEVHPETPPRPIDPLAPRRPF